MRSDNPQLPCVQTPTSSNSLQLPHGHYGHGDHGGRGGCDKHGGRGKHGGRCGQDLTGQDSPKTHSGNVGYPPQWANTGS